MFEDNITVVPNEETSLNLLSNNISFQASTFKEKLPTSTSSIDLDGGISFTCSSEESKLYVGRFVLIFFFLFFNKDLVQMT